MKHCSIVATLGYAGRKLWRHSSPTYSPVAAAHIVAAIDVLTCYSSDLCTSRVDLQGAWSPPPPWNASAAVFVPSGDSCSPTLPLEDASVVHAGLPVNSEDFENASSDNSTISVVDPFDGVSLTHAPASVLSLLPLPSVSTDVSRSELGPCQHTETLETPATSASKSAEHVPETSGVGKPPDASKPAMSEHDSDSASSAPTAPGAVLRLNDPEDEVPNAESVAWVQKLLGKSVREITRDDALAVACMFKSAGCDSKNVYISELKRQLLFLEYGYRRSLYEFYLLHDVLRGADCNVVYEVAVLDKGGVTSMERMPVRIVSLEKLKTMLPSCMVCSEDGYLYDDSKVCQDSMLVDGVLHKCFFRPLHRYVHGSVDEMRSMSARCPRELKSMSFGSSFEH